MPYQKIQRQVLAPPDHTVELEIVERQRLPLGVQSRQPCIRRLFFANGLHQFVLGKGTPGQRFQPCPQGMQFLGQEAARLGALGSRQVERKYGLALLTKSISTLPNP